MWGRRHQYVNLSFLGIFTFTAPYLPWVLLAFSGAPCLRPVPWVCAVDGCTLVACARLHGTLAARGPACLLRGGGSPTGLGDT